MAFLDKITPAQYRLQSLNITRDGAGGITAKFKIEIFTTDGRGLTHMDYSISLNASEITALSGFVSTHLADFEAETGLTKLHSEEV